MGALTAAIVGGVASVVGTGASMYSSTKNKKNAERAAKGVKGEIEFIEENR